MATRHTRSPEKGIQQNAVEMPVGPLAPPAPEPDSLTCSLDQAARHMGVSQKTVRTLVSRGEITAWRIGQRRLRISRASVSDYLDQHRVGADPVPPPDRSRRVNHAAHQRSVAFLRKIGVM